ncbi:DEKNAAC101939 [Brettanomyces naardenensis]|uniref:dynamin GTPase n=1 Tax=Brettanomyces naardenensis TaxID=13370 RepID=A0A448YJE6_BRENA|nr:DEKNAAC101939 [Brettanomyces naardenensis]
MSELRTTATRRGISSLQAGTAVRTISFIGIGKAASKAVKFPAYIGGGLAAAGSYAMYKLDQAQDYTANKLKQVKGIMADIKEGIGSMFPGSSDDEGGNKNNGGGSGGGEGAAAGAAAAAAGVSVAEDEDVTSEDDDDDEEDEEAERERDQSLDDAMMNLTKQMIEIRSLLMSVDGATALTLPAIVVVGSQSSGKSSVLEAIVGQEFLPKGSNMVTRRPIELTLVNDPSQAAEVAEFPALKMYNMTDFQQVQKILRDLNMAVPDEETVSGDPIQLTIKSPKVPDLSLVDLPGYIQVEAADQPASLKQKIREVCARYLEEPNIILAISAADVDLANSSALRAAKRADPKGERTIGVITKLDLVTPEDGKLLLTNRKYPLRMGYVGVITRAPSAGSIFRRKTGSQAYVAQQGFERSYFKENRDEFNGTSVGTKVLKRRLMKVLESSMARALKPMHDKVANELEETSYQFKVEFNDRDLTSEKYMAQTIDNLKLSVKEFSERFGRPELKSLLRSELDQKVLDLLAQRYWNKPPVMNKKRVAAQPSDYSEPPLNQLSEATQEDSYWRRKLELSTASLTKLGVGRLSTTLISDALLTEIGVMLDNSELRTHPGMKEAIKEAAVAVLSKRFNSTSDQVENCIKPYKYEIDVEPREWSLSRQHAVGLLREELKQCNEAYRDLKRTVGGNKLKQIMTYLQNENNSVGQSIAKENIGFSPGLILRGKEALFLSDRAALLSMRLKFLRSSSCKYKENKYRCPEAFMDVVADKLTQTAVLFLNVELLSDFYYSFPRELESKLSSGLTPEQVEAYAKEDPKVKRHIELQERKELLDLALGKIEDVMALRKQMA